MTTDRRSRRQLILLVGVLVALAVVLIWRFTVDRAGAAPRRQAQTGTASRPSNQAGRGDAGGPVTELKLDALHKEAGEVKEAERNPFRFQQKAPPPSPVGAAAPRAQTYVPPVVQGPPPLPPIPLRYVGVLTPASNERVAVLADARGASYYGREGELVDGRYRLLRIAGDSVDIAYADGRGRQTLRLTAQPQ
ncbi:MAG TPA: hypothetical protein VL173_03445 [Vicinamibacterales bacterium]|jgi:hypothetical protein|nr:hypothetical protein [Vicinamibacterales bacterium]